MQAQACEATVSCDSIVGHQGLPSLVESRPRLIYVLMCVGCPTILDECTYPKWFCHFCNMPLRLRDKNSSLHLRSCRPATPLKVTFDIADPDDSLGLTHDYSISLRLNDMQQHMIVGIDRRKAGPCEPQLAYYEASQNIIQLLGLKVKATKPTLSMPSSQLTI